MIEEGRGTDEGGGEARGREGDRAGWGKEDKGRAESEAMGKGVGTA